MCCLMFWPLHEIPLEDGSSMHVWQRFKPEHHVIQCICAADAWQVKDSYAKLLTKRLYTDRLCLRQHVIAVRSSFLQLSSSGTRDWICGGSACAAAKAANRSSCLPSANIQIGTTVPQNWEAKTSLKGLHSAKFTDWNEILALCYGTSGAGAGPKAHQVTPQASIVRL